jgi:ribosomal protein S18 acetylase RimI-like enzyme
MDITYTNSFSSNYNKQIRDLYKNVNDLMKVHPVFTKDILENKLSKPSDISLENPDHDIYIALNKNRVVGMMCLEKIDDETNELSTLSIHPEYRRKGIGTKLMEIARNSKKIHLTCFGTNDKALKFYNAIPCEKTHEEHRHSSRTNVDYTLVHFTYSCL